jgi:tetratricopeptide (TPR) repeat protein
MIIFGTRSYFRTNKAVQYGFCENCSNFGKLQSYNATNCFHLYFIPVVPIEGRRRTHQICSKCDVGRAYELPVFDEMISRLKERSADAIVALLSGEQTIPNDGPNQPPIECVGLLHDVVSWLFAANDAEFCQGVIAQLNEPKLRYAQVMTRAAIETAQGNIEAALGSYREANLGNPKAFEPLYFSARLLRAKKRFDEAIASLQKACSLASPEIEFDLRLQLVDLQTEGKKHADAVATFDWLLAQKPELQSNKQFMALVKTARKKAGIK